MSSWQIKLPMRDPDQTVAEALADPPGPELTGEDRAVAVNVMLEAAGEGIETMGQLADRLESASPVERRALLDRARESAGLDSTADVEARERFEAANDPIRLKRQQRRRTMIRPVGGGFVEIDEDEIERERRRDELREEAWRRRQEERRAEAEAIRLARERYVEENRGDAYLDPFSGPMWSPAP